MIGKNVSILCNSVLRIHLDTAWATLSNSVFMSAAVSAPLVPPNLSICFLLVDFHIFQELIFENSFEKY